jgi:hypothetical protein
MNLSFLEDLFKPVGKGFSELDRFVDREMPFDSGWGAPAAAVAAYFGGPALMGALGQGGGAAGLGAAEGTGAAAGGGGMLSSLGGSGGAFGGELFQLGGAGAGGESALGLGGMNGYLSSIGLDGGGSFAGQEAFQLPASAYTPEYLNMLADYQGVDAGDPSLFSRLTGNTEQGLYSQENIAQKTAGQTASDMLKKRAQQSALSQLSKSGSDMQQQGQQSPQMQLPQAMMSKGQPVNTTAALLSLLQEKEMLRQPRISLI